MVSDPRRNLQSYFSDRASTRVDDLIDCPSWRQEFDAHGSEELV